jgi:hypothetical protein
MALRLEELRATVGEEEAMELIIAWQEGMGSDAHQTEALSQLH